MNGFLHTLPSVYLLSNTGSNFSRPFPLRGISMREWILRYSQISLKKNLKEAFWLVVDIHNTKAVVVTCDCHFIALCDLHWVCDIDTEFSWEWFSGNSPTAEAINQAQTGISAATAAAAAANVIRPRQQLLYLAEVLGFGVQFTDFPKVITLAIWDSFLGQYNIPWKTMTIT